MVFWTIISSIIASLAGLAVYLYYSRKGQFEDPESVKYQLFREENPDS
ncbi:cbb3-type cytochrome oxidase assembly protein CcoS [Candidatus Protochlamydia phocaeensis]|nr:cbb3-type cytochrome oxidase assembly protein CcoS [Candidatus Protochlamydia phocaeensis]